MSEPLLDEPRRLRGVKVSLDLLKDTIFCGDERGQVGSRGPFRVVNGIPQNATLWCITQDRDGDGVTFVFEHQDFDLVPADVPIPMGPIEYRKLE